VEEGKHFFTKDPASLPFESRHLLQPTIIGQVDRSVTDRKVSVM
jgi:hypothetical protein